jgi:cell division protein FtsQ
VSRPRTSSPARLARRHGPGLLLLILLTAVIIGVGIGARIWMRTLPVRGVRIEGVRIVPSEEIFHLAAVPMEKQLSDVNLSEVRDRVRRNPFVKDVAVHRDPPDRILIQVDERVPQALIAAHRMLYVDADGMLMPVIRSDNAFDLPVITGAAEIQSCEIGNRLTHPAIREALLLVMVARQLDDGLYRRISEVHIDASGDLLLYTADGGVPVVVGRGDITTKLEKFEAFWTSVVASRGVQSLTSVDLRFADQVVVRWETDDKQMLN